MKRTLPALLLLLLAACKKSGTEDRLADGTYTSTAQEMGMPVLYTKTGRVTDTALIHGIVNRWKSGSSIDPQRISFTPSTTAGDGVRLQVSGNTGSIYLRENFIGPAFTQDPSFYATRSADIEATQGNDLLLVYHDSLNATIPTLDHAFLFAFRYSPVYTWEPRVNAATGDVTYRSRFRPIVLVRRRGSELLLPMTSFVAKYQQPGLGMTTWYLYNAYNTAYPELLQTKLQASDSFVIQERQLVLSRQ